MQAGPPPVAKAQVQMRVVEMSQLPELAELEASIRSAMELGGVTEDSPSRRIAIKTIAAFHLAMGAEIVKAGITTAEMHRATIKCASTMILNCAQNISGGGPEKFGAAALALCLDLVDNVKHSCRPGGMEFIAHVNHASVGDFDFRQHMKDGDT
jgi:hypothetical protein